MKIYKKTYTEEEQISVPVTREELVIKKRITAANDDTEPQIETIRTHLKVDDIEINVRHVKLEKVDIQEV